jgi:hypothetical protein
MSDKQNKQIRALFQERLAYEERIAELEARGTALAAALREAIQKYDDGSWRHEDIFKLARQILDLHAPGWREK